MAPQFLGFAISNGRVKKKRKIKGVRVQRVSHNCQKNTSHQGAKSALSRVGKKWQKIYPDKFVFKKGISGLQGVPK